MTFIGILTNISIFGWFCLEFWC